MSKNIKNILVIAVAVIGLFGASVFVAPLLFATVVSYETFMVYESVDIPYPTETNLDTTQFTYGDSFYISLEVRVDTIVENMHMLTPEKHELIPYDGTIFHNPNVVAYYGESVFDVLQREMRQNNIHMSSRFTPMFGSAYVEAIHNLYEFDGGPLSGWMYRVNGDFPNFGSSLYIVNEGYVVEWLYTLDLGRDVHAYWVGGINQ